MRIQSTKISKARNISTKAKPADKENGDDKGSPIQDLVVKGAYASGGALAGVGLGVVTGSVLSNLMGTSSLMTAGGVVGAIAGAGTAVALADSDNKGDALTKVALSWGGASLGSAAGQFLGLQVLSPLATAAGVPTLATFAPLLGTATGAMAGAALPNARSNHKLMKLVGRGASMGALGSLGLTIGLMGKALAVSSPGLEHMGAFAPYLGAASGTALGYSVSNIEDAGAMKIARSALGTSLGYAVGSAVGAIAYNSGGSVLYTMGLPAAGAVVGTLGMFAARAYNEPATPYHKGAEIGASTVATASVGTILGDVVGHALTNLTGDSLYSQIGFVAGGLNGVGLGLEWAGVDTKKAQPVLLSGSAGVGTGALVGTALGALTGHQAYTRLGAVAGGLSGTLLAVDKTGLLDTKGAAECVVGVTAGTGVGALLGASLDFLTGQQIWGFALPALGAAAGGLSALAVTFSDGSGGKGQATAA